MKEAKHILVRNRIRVVDQLASKYGWMPHSEEKEISKVTYRKEDVQIHVFLSNLTVTTELDHPKKGKTQLHRRNLTMNQVEKIFKNPRSHTGSGYYERKEGRR